MNVGTRELRTDEHSRVHHLSGLEGGGMSGTHLPLRVPPASFPRGSSAHGAFRRQLLEAVADISFYTPVICFLGNQ